MVIENDEKGVRKFDSYSLYIFNNRAAIGTKKTECDFLQKKHFNPFLFSKQFLDQMNHKRKILVKNIVLMHSKQFCCVNF